MVINLIFKKILYLIKIQHNSVVVVIYNENVLFC